MKTYIIGIDADLEVCKIEGYMTMEYTAGLFIGEKLNKNANANFTLTNPDRWTDDGKPNTKEGKLWYLLYEPFSFNELLQIVEDPHLYEMVGKVCGWDSNPPELVDPSPFDMLYLASDIHRVIGLQ